MFYALEVRTDPNPYH